MLCLVAMGSRQLADEEDEYTYMAASGREMRSSGRSSSSSSRSYGGSSRSYYGGSYSSYYSSSYYSYSSYNSDSSSSTGSYLGTFFFYCFFFTICCCIVNILCWRLNPAYRVCCIENCPCCADNKKKQAASKSQYKDMSNLKDLKKM